MKENTSISHTSNAVVKDTYKGQIYYDDDYQTEQQHQKSGYSYSYGTEGSNSGWTKYLPSAVTNFFEGSSYSDWSTSYSNYGSFYQSKLISK